MHCNPAQSLSSLMFSKKTCCSAVAFLKSVLQVLFNALHWPVALAAGSIVMVLKVEGILRGGGGVCVCVGRGGMTLQQWQLAAQLAEAISSQWRAFPLGPVI